jgi:hypothetical protein
MALLNVSGGQLFPEQSQLVLPPYTGNPTKISLRSVSSNRPHLLRPVHADQTRSLSVETERRRHGSRKRLH